jgi:hypothetical protein
MVEVIEESIFYIIMPIHKTVEKLVDMDVHWTTSVGVIPTEDYSNENGQNYIFGHCLKII